MRTFQRALITSIAAAGIAGATLAPAASAQVNNGAYAKSGEAQKVKQSNCASLEGKFGTAVDNGLKAVNAGDKITASIYTTAATIYLNQLQSSGCEGW